MYGPELIWVLLREPTDRAWLLNLEERNGTGHMSGGESGLDGWLLARF